MPSEKPEVLIVGGGAAGLAAASELLAAGVAPRLVEAGKRLGGRIHTVKSAGFSGPVDLGAEFIHGKPEATWSLIRRFELPVYESPEGKVLFQSFILGLPRWEEIPDFWERLGKVLGGRAPLARDRSLAKALSRRRADRRDLELALNFVKGFHAADPELISWKSILEETSEAESIEGDRLFRILGGHRELISALERATPGLRADLGSAVTEIRWSAGQVEASLNSGEVIAARAAILTVPPGPLSRIRFLPALTRAKARALSRIRSGAVVKVLFQFREPFWERKAGSDAIFFHSLRKEFPTWWTALPFRSRILTGWTGGPEALSISARSREEIRECALRALSALFGISARELNGLEEAFAYHDWVHDPYSLGAYSYIGTGGIHAPRWLAEPLAGTLFFAGEATQCGGLTGTVDGAIASGRRSARQFLSAAKAGRAAA